ncbi:MAG TPA: metal ABC transporter permease [Chthoniobacteraceae bacterium]|jgi:ABC-type Mn2+/Zn2+ transport system permease subunit|nr:metal ABC transporter permease [Chthoniobacteraceae bacterium]
MIPDSIPKALLAALFLGLSLPITGRHLILGRSILLGLAVPQISMAGIAFLFLGSALGWSWTTHFADDSARAAAGALLFAVPTLLFLSAIQRAGRHLSEAWLAVAYLASFAAANLMLSSNAIGETYLSDLFHGRLILISDEALRLLAVSLAITGAVALALRRRLLLILTDPDFAAVARVRVGGWVMLLALLNGCVIGVSVAAVGPLVTFGFLVLPALTAAAFARSLRTHLAWSIAAGLIAAAAGYHYAYQWDFPLGDCTVVCSTVLLILCRAGARVRSLF